MVMVAIWRCLSHRTIGEEPSKAEAKQISEANTRGLNWKPVRGPSFGAQDGTKFGHFGDASSHALKEPHSEERRRKLHSVRSEP